MTVPSQQTAPSLLECLSRGVTVWSWRAVRAFIEINDMGLEGNVHTYIHTYIHTYADILSTSLQLSLLLINR